MYILEKLLQERENKIINRSVINFMSQKFVCLITTLLKGKKKEILNYSKAPAVSIIMVFMKHNSKDPLQFST